MPSKQLTTQWKKIGINKCKNKEGKIDYNKLSKLYLSLIAKELNNSKKENRQNIISIEKNNPNYEELIKQGLSGEEKLIKDVIKKINEKFHLKEAFEEYKLGEFNPNQLISKSSEKDVKDTFYKNISTKDAIASANNRLNFYLKFKSSVRPTSSSSEVSEDGERAFVFGTLNELKNVYNSRSFFFKLTHRQEMRELKDLIHKTKEIIHKDLLLSRGPLTKIDEKIYDQNGLSNYNDYCYTNDEFVCNLYKFFGLKTFTEIYNSSNSNINKDYAIKNTNGLFENDRPKNVLNFEEFELRHQIEVKEIKTQLELNNKILNKNSELIQKLSENIDINLDDNINNENNLDDSFSDNSGMKEKDDSFSL